MTVASDYRYYDLYNINYSLSVIRDQLQDSLVKPLLTYYTSAYVINAIGKYIAFVLHRTSNPNGERPIVIFFISEADSGNEMPIGTYIQNTELYQGRGLGFGILNEDWSASLQNDILSSTGELSDFRNKLHAHHFIGTSQDMLGRFICSGCRNLEVSDVGQYKMRLSNTNRFCHSTSSLSTANEGLLLGIATVSNDYGMALYLHYCLPNGNRADSERYGYRFAFANQAIEGMRFAFGVKHQSMEDNRNLTDFNVILDNQLFAYVYDGKVDCSSSVTVRQNNLCCLNYASSVWDCIPYANDLPDAKDGSALSLPLYMVYNGENNMKRLRVDSELLKLSIARYGNSDELLSRFKLGKVTAQYLSTDSSWRWHGGILVSK